MTSLLGLILSVVAIVPGFFGGNVTDTVSNLATTAVASVELNLAEVSPRGEAGGFAVPASGESTSCAISFSLNPVPVGSNAYVSYATTLDGQMTGTTLNQAAIYRCDSTANNCDGTWDVTRASNGLASTNWTSVWKSSITYGDPNTSGTKSAVTAGLTENHNYIYRFFALYNTAYGGEVGHSGSVVCSRTLGVGTSVDPDAPDPAECSDGLDNDGDGGIDWDGGGSSLSVSVSLQNAEIRNTLNTSAGSTVIPSNSNLFNDIASAREACRVIGYDTATINQTSSYASASGMVTKWNGSSWSTIQAGSGASCVGGNTCLLMQGGSCDTWVYNPCASYSYPNNSYITGLTCSNPIVAGAPADPDCTGPDDPTEDDTYPTVTLEVQNTTTGTPWTSASIVINSGEETSLRWTSTNATSCLGGGAGFSTGGAVNGTDTNIIEPLSGNTSNYSVQCDDGAGHVVYDSLNVTTQAGISIDADPSIVHQGDPSTITWNTGTTAPALCSIVGPGINMPSLSSSSGSQEVTIYSQSTYVLNCGADGSDQATVRVLPVIQET